MEVLGVRDILVCGHSHCGAVGEKVRGDGLDAVPAVRDWLARTSPRPVGTAQGPEVAQGV